MIIVKSPLRISLFGGSTDYEDFYSKNTSLIVGFSIDKYVYVGVQLRDPIFFNNYKVSYSRLEEFKDISECENNLIRAVLTCYNKANQKLEISIFADMPKQTGLGASSACCTALIQALQKTLYNNELHKYYLAKNAINIERKVLNEPGGIQDQIWSAYGGFNSIEIERDGSFCVKPMPVCEGFESYFVSCMTCIYVGKKCLRPKTTAYSHIGYDKTPLLNLAKEGYQALSQELVEDVGMILRESWEEKKKISSLISNKYIDEITTDLHNMGVWGYKLLGAGGTGFLLVIGDILTINSVKNKYKKNIFDFAFSQKGTEVL